MPRWFWVIYRQPGNKSWFKYDTSFLTVVIPGDFNAKSNLWYTNDINSYKGFKTRTHKYYWWLLAVIDLIFKTQKNLVVESELHSLLYPNCHHHITFAKFSLKTDYPVLMNGKSSIIKILSAFPTKPLPMMKETHQG